MNLTINRTTLLGAIDPCAKVAGGKTHILTYLLLETQNGQLKITGSDGNLFVSRTVTCEAKTEGALCLSAKTLRDVVASAKDDVFSLETVGAQVVAQCGKMKSKLPYMDGDLYHTMTPQGDCTCVTLQSDPIPKLISVSAAGENLGGLFAIFECVDVRKFGDRIAMVSTNKQHAIRWIIDGDIESTIDLTPATIKSIHDLGVTDEFILDVYRNAYVFESSNGSVISSVTGGVFPDTEKGFPGELPITMTCDKSELVAMCKSALMIQGETGRIDFECSKGELHAKSVGEKGEFSSSVPCVSNQDFKIACNGKYVVSVCNVCPDEAIFSVSVANQPIKITSTTEPDFTALIMPMAL